MNKFESIKKMFESFVDEFDTTKIMKRDMN